MYKTATTSNTIVINNMRNIFFIVTANVTLFAENAKKLFSKKTRLPHLGTALLFFNY